MKSVRIREIEISDAESFLVLLKQLDQETTFMLYEPNEWSFNLTIQEQRIKQMKQQSNQTILLADHENQIIGHIAILGGFAKRNQFTASLVLGILQKYQGKGIGTILMKEAIQWANKQNLLRLELTVMTHNKSAISFYKKNGFVIEGVRKHALKISELFVDEYYMSKLLV